MKCLNYIWKVEEPLVSQTSANVGQVVNDSRQYIKSDEILCQYTINDRTACARFLLSVAQIIK